MNIETANRLVNLRKEHNLSQEALAEKLGISRQAVSKWERAEASPDTDNLITLAKLYGMSLDELLNMQKLSEQNDQAASDESPEFESSDDGDSNNDENANESSHFSRHGIHVDDNGDHVHIDWHGIHVIDKNGDEVHVDRHGVHVKDAEDGDEVHVDRHGVNVNEKKWSSEEWKDNYKDEWKNWSGDWGKSTMLADFPIAAIVLIGYLIIGLVTHLWHPTWIMLLAIPFFDSVVKAIRHRSFRKVSYFTLVLAAFLILGCCFNLWNPAWILFLTIPIYHLLAKYFSRLWYNRKAKKDTVTD